MKSALILAFLETCLAQVWSLNIALIYGLHNNFQIQHGFLSDTQNMGMYEGEMLDGQPHGVGTIIYLTNDKFGRANYTGEWRSGVYIFH